MQKVNYIVLYKCTNIDNPQIIIDITDQNIEERIFPSRTITSRHQTISIPPNLIQRWEAQGRVKEETGVRVISLRRNASKQES